MSMVCFLFCLLSVQSGIAIECHRVGGAESGQVLFRTCVSFEPGEMGARCAMVLRDRGGNDLVADFVPTAHWPDGSIRIVAVRASLAAHRCSGSFRLVAHRTPQPRGDALGLSRRGRDVLVDTGPMTLNVGGSDSESLSHVTWRGKAVDGLNGGLRLRARVDGVTYRPGESLLGLDPGRASAVVHLSGRLIGDDSTVGPEYALRLGFLAGSGQIGCRVRLRGGSFEGVCSGVSVSFDPPWSRSGAPVVIRAGEIGVEKVLGSAETIRLRSLPSRVELSCGELNEPLTAKSGLGLILKGCRPDFMISLPGFGRLHPWSVSATQGGAVEISLLNEHFTWEPHVSFERRFVLGLLPAGRNECTHFALLSEGAAFGLARAVERRSLIFARAARPRGCESLAELLFQVARLLQERLRQEWALWDGFMDFGDYRKSYGLWANQEYDPVFGLIKKFLWSNDRTDLEMARIALDHWFFFDRAGPDDPEAPEGVPWVHGAAHRSERTEAGHMWVDGLLAYYLLTGEKEYREGALKVGGALASALGRLKNTEQERNLAWALAGLCALTDAGFDRFEEPMNRAAAWVRSRQVANGLIAFKKTFVGEEQCYSVNSWVTAGITVDALFRHYRVTGDERSADCAVRAMRALLRLGRDTRNGIVFQTIVTARSNGELRSRKSPISGGQIALFSLGAARAFEMTGEKRFRSCAQSLLEKALIEIKNDVPDYVGEDLALILRSGLDVVAATSDR